MAKTVANLMEVLYDHRTYRDCRITRPETSRDKIVCHNIAYTPLRLEFTRQIEGFGVEISVVAFLAGMVEPNHVVLVSGLADPEIRKLWFWLEGECNKRDDYESRERRVLEILGQVGRTHKEEDARR